MIICKSPFRISLFGGGTDYKNFYQENGSLIIGTTIDKYVYFSVKYKSPIFKNPNIISYSSYEKIDDINNTQNPLFKAVLQKYKNNSKLIDLHYFSDIPARTGLGGSSSCCCCLIYAFNKLNGHKTNKKNLANAAIDIERNILNEPGGIQDQIWASYGGFNTITINKNGNFDVKKIDISDEFKKELLNSMVLIFSGEQRNNHESAKHKNNENKKEILEIAKQSLNFLKNQDIKKIGQNLYLSWLQKKQITNKIETTTINEIIEDCKNIGSYGSKLLGSGQGGFILTMADPKTKKKIVEKYKENILEFNFENKGTSTIYLDNK